MDVKIAFLDGSLTEKVYTIQPDDVSLVNIGQYDIIDTIYRYKSYPGTFSLKDLGEATYIMRI